MFLPRQCTVTTPKYMKKKKMCTKKRDLKILKKLGIFSCGKTTVENHDLKSQQQQQQQAL